MEVYQPSEVIKKGPGYTMNRLKILLIASSLTIFACAQEDPQSSTGSNPQSVASPQSTSAGSAAQGAGHESGEMENKGTPAAGTPSPPIATPSSSMSSATGETSESENSNSVFQGCLSGDVNNYQVSAHGKNYRLQGNTSMLKGLSGHRVEITGEESNATAIRVNGARDLGSSCSGK
jgi:hypothetical protein